MIILDTNVLSALMRKEPDDSVVGWLDRQPPESIWITTITLFESRLGLALLPARARRLVSARRGDLIACGGCIASPCRIAGWFVLSESPQRFPWSGTTRA